MSLYGSLFSGVSGLNAQSLALGTISENITKVKTVGYKARTSHFATLVTGSADDGSVGGVKHISFRNIAAQGILQQTTNATDVGISGEGFFPVTTQADDGQATGDLLFTRSGSFSIGDGGLLGNAHGHFLMGWRLNADGNFVDTQNVVIPPDPTSDADLVPVDITTIGFGAQGTSEVNLSASFPSNMIVGDEFAIPTSLLDDLGGNHNVAFNFTKADHVGFAGQLSADTATDFTVAGLETEAALVAGGLSDQTDIDVRFQFVSQVAGVSTYDITVTPTNGSIGGAASTTFQRSWDAAGSPIEDDLTEIEVAWDGITGAKNSIIALDFGDITTAAGAQAPATGAVNAENAVLRMDIDTSDPDDTFVSGETALVEFDQFGNLAAPDTLSTVIDWNNQATFAPDSDLSINFGTVGSNDGLSAFGEDFSLGSTSRDGILFDELDGVSINEQGFVIAQFKNGTSLPIFQVPLANFGNPNGLSLTEGNAFKQTLEAGDFFLNFAGEGGVGSFTPQTLEASTVDIAREFANMIITQRAFSSASTVITTADEMLQELVQIKR